MTVSPEERGIKIRLDALAALIREQEAYLSQLKLREERLKYDLIAVTRIRRAG